MPLSLPCLAVAMWSPSQQSHPAPDPPPSSAAAPVFSGPRSLRTRWFYKGLFNSDCWQTFQRKAFFVGDRQCLCSEVGRSRCEWLQWRVEKTLLWLSYPFGWDDKKNQTSCVSSRENNKYWRLKTTKGHAGNSPPFPFCS